MYAAVTKHCATLSVQDFPIENVHRKAMARNVWTKAAGSLRQFMVLRVRETPDDGGPRVHRMA